MDGSRAGARLSAYAVLAAALVWAAAFLFIPAPALALPAGQAHGLEAAGPLAAAPMQSMSDEDGRAYTVRIQATAVRGGGALAGVGFTAKVNRYGGEGAIRGYLRGDGELSDEPCVLETGDDGAVTVPGIGAETVTFEQVGAPDGYAVHPGGFTLTIDGESDPGDGEAGPTATVVGNMGVAVEGVDAETGVISVSAPVGSLADGPDAPTASMEFKGAADGEWGHVTEAFVVRRFDVRASVTLPGNVCEYPKYCCIIAFNFHGMHVDTSTLAVTVDGEDAKTKVGGILDSGSGVTLRLYDVLGLGVRVSGGSVVGIECKAWNTWGGSQDSPVVGKGFVSLTHTKSLEEADSLNSFSTGYLAKSYSHSLRMTVRDASSGAPLRGAYVTVRVAECADGEIVGKYVDGDGTIRDGYRTILTGADGVVYLQGIASGSYVVEYVRVPTGYVAPADGATLTVSSQLDEEGKKVSLLDAEMAGGGGRVLSTDPQADRIEAALELAKPLELPMTGAGGALPWTALACALAAAGLLGAVALAAAGARPRKGAGPMGP